MLAILGCALLLGGGGAATGASTGGITATAAPPAPVAAAGPKKSAPKDPWAEVERLIQEQKLEQAASRIQAILAAADRRGDADARARALVRATEVRIALGGFETAVRQLREARWPPGLLPRTGLELSVANALTIYLATHSWEINSRERVETGGTLDLARWTREQIVAAAESALLEAWKDRAALGAEPTGKLAYVLVANSYPAEVRGTLRDTVSYLFVDLLANQSLWTPAETNDLYRLDLGRLLALDSPDTAGTTGTVGTPGTRARGASGAAPHPLERLVAVLADLEAWHAAAGQRAAALEARLERARRLSAAFSAPADRRRIREDLERRLAAARDLSWWAEGQAVLADLLREVDEPQALVQAHDAALAGARAYPRSPGAADCRHAAAEIEQPDFQVQAMASDGTGRRSIAVDHRNLARLFFRAYRVDVARRLEAGADQPFPEPWSTRELVSLGPPASSWVESLPPTPDYRRHRTWVVPRVAGPGAYMVVASERQSFSERHNRLARVSLVLGDLVLLRNEEPGGATRLRLLTGSSGEPVAGARIRVFRYDRQNTVGEAATLTTGADGAASFEPPRTEEPSSWARYLMLAERGADLALLDLYLGLGAPMVEGDTVLIFTDRSIYRPGQTVRWKALAYSGDREAGHLALAAHRDLAVKLTDSNSQDVATAKVTTNDFGTAAGELVVPAGRPLGTWVLHDAKLSGATQIRVEEYKRPTFEVQLLAPAAAPRLNRPAAFRGEARYYFGLPVTSGKVRWNVTRLPVFPPWWWEGSGTGAAAESGSQEVATGTSALGGDGTFTADFTPAADERLGKEKEKDVTYRYRLHAEVTDDGGETRTAERSFRLGFVAIEAAIESDDRFLDPGTAAEMTVLRRDLDGAPRPGAGDWRLLSLRQPERASLPAEEPAAASAVPGETAAFHTPGDLLVPRWQRTPPAVTLRRFGDGAEVAHGSLAHDEQGRALVKLPPLPPGAYRLRYETHDDSGGTAVAQREVIVAGGAGGAGGAPLVVPAWLEVQRPETHVGGIVAILAHSGFPGQRLELEIWRGKDVERRALVAGDAPQRIELPVREADRGGIALRLVAVRDHQLMELNAKVTVPWDNRELTVEYQTFRDLLRPGARETWRVKVTEKGARGAEPAAAELLAYMYDRSLDTYVVHRPPRPLDLLPSGIDVGPLTVSLGDQSGSPWGSTPPELPPDAGLHGDGLHWIEGYGVGGLGWQGISVAGGVEGGAPLAIAGGPGHVYSHAIPMPAPKAPAPPPPAGAIGAAEQATLRARDAGPGAPGQALAPTLRSDFSETAFWQPHLLTGADGTAAIEFTVPDSVTSWSVWMHALTRDFRSGEDHREARSAKELMVRPYLPRFLREGDRAELEVVVNDAAAQGAFDGEVTLDILDPEKPEAEASLLGEFGVTAEAARRRFHVEAGKSAALTFPLAVPRRVGQVAFKVIAQAGDTSDGELRPLPLLPSRVHLAQSRFVALHDRDTRTMTFDDMKAAGDPSRIDEQLVVTLDAQLFYSVLAAVPYLVEYPHECTEQTLNRFLGTAILSSLFTRYPAVSRMAAQLAQRNERKTELEPFSRPDPNRQMALEETPWLLESQGKREVEERRLLAVLDPRIAKAQQELALAKLDRDQLSNGAFPWWPGGPPSDYMTLYLLYGLAKAGEFGVAVPRKMVNAGWHYIGERYQSEIRHKLDRPDCDCAWEFLTLLNYVASAYPDPSWLGDALPIAERRRILDASFRHWREHSPYLKGLLALTLERMGRHQDARLVFDSVMDSAKTTPEEGTFWQPEERSWLWYHDTIESHAFALRALMELNPKDPRLDGLVQWLFLNKQLGHWKSTRATAEVVYSLAKYLDSHHELAVREAAKVEAGGSTTELTFEPDRYTGKKAQVVVSGPRLGPQDATITVSKETPGLLFASATWHFSTEELPKEARGDLFAVERRYFRRVLQGQEMVLQPLAEGAVLAPGDEVEVQLSLRSRAPAEYVHLRDPRPAGFEPGAVVSGWKWDLGLTRYEEVRDSGTNFFFEWLPAGEYTLKYRVRAALAGTFRVGPATVQSMYAPEFTAYSAGNVVRVQAAAAAAP
jgi:alpha-2-macroglobulin